MTGARRRRSDGWLLAAWVAFLAGTLVGLHAVGGDLSPPPLTDAGGVGPWLQQRPPVAAAFAGARLAVLALAWYLLVATVAGFVARASGAAVLLRGADAVATPLVRRLVHGAVGVALVGSTAAGAGPGVAEAAAQPGPAAVGTRLLPDGDPPPPPRMRLLPAPDGAASPSGGGGPAPAEGRTWTVQPGDHLWAVAARVLGEAWGRQPSDAEVHPYWRAVVDANRPRLHDAADPDRIFAGQVLDVPPPPARPA